MQILVVTDDDHVREEVRFGFPSNVEVLLAKDARVAWEILGSTTPDAGLVSLRSGSAGGFALLSDMSQQERLREIPVLMLLERDQDRWLGEQAGARSCITKPVEASELVHRTLALL